MMPLIFCCVKQTVVYTLVGYMCHVEDKYLLCYSGDHKLLSILYQVV